MKREEADYMQDTSNKQTERIKVSELDIIANMISEKPYYEIKYKEVGEDYYHIGYSSYNLDFVLEWKDKCFEVVSERKSVAGWIPVSERLPEDYVPVNITWVNHNPDPYYASIKDVPFTATGICYEGEWYWYSVVCEDYLKEYGYYEPDVVDDEIEITAWMPLPEPYRESEVENGK